MRIQTILSGTIVAIAMLLFSGCSGHKTNGADAVGLNYSVSITPANALVTVGETRAYSAQNVFGSEYAWAVIPANLGTFAVNGTFTAAASGTGVVVATSRKDARYVGTTNITVVPATFVLSGNAGQAGVVLAYTDGSAKTAIADGMGNFAITVPRDWSGTVTPALAGFTFSPASLTFSNVAANQSAQDFTATAITYTVSGGLGASGAGATLAYTDGSAKTATVDGSGNYSFTVSYNWSGTITPTLTGFTFSPASRTYTNVLANQTAQNFTPTAITYTVSGALGASGAGTTLAYTDGSAKTAAADGSGNYSFAVSYNWSGTVTPTLTGFTFSPASRTYTNVLANQVAQNYTPTPITYTISGALGATGAGATLAYMDGTAKTATADGSGNYSFTVSYNWSGTVTPTLTGFTFSPASKTYSNVLANQATQNYTPTAITYTVSGGSGASGAGATLAYMDGSAKTATADGSGNYSFAVSYNWSGTVTPSLTGFTFSPASRTYTNVLANQTAQNYTPTAITYTISGALGATGAGATLAYTDGTAKTATADGSGNYSFTVSYNWSGTVTPTLAGYSFSPVNRTYTLVQANQTAQDYTPSVVTLSVVSTDPTNNAIAIPITKTIAVTYSDTITLTDASGVTLKNGTTSVPVTVSVSGKDLLIDPTPLLLRNTVYTVTIPAGTIQGVGSATSITFTTIQITFTEQTGVLVSDKLGAHIGRTDMSNNIIVSESGVIHVVWKLPEIMSTTPSPTDGIYYSRSSNGGVSFEPSIRVRDAIGLATTYANQVEPEIACSGGDLVYIAYTNAQKQLELVRSINGGDTWQTPMVFGTAGTLSEHKHIVAMDSNVFITANDGDAPQAASVDNGGNTFLGSLDFGVSFQPAITGLMGYPLHAILVNPLSQDIYITGTEPTGVNGPTNIFYTRSVDGGVTFQPSVNTNHLINHAGYCFDRSGRIVIIGRDGKLVIGDMNTNTWTESSTVGSSSLPLQSTMTVDGDNTLYRVGTAASDGKIHITYSKDGGLSFTDLLIDAGTYPNAASSVNMSGVAMVYIRDNGVYYSYRNPNVVD